MTLYRLFTSNCKMISILFIIRPICLHKEKDIFVPIFRVMIYLEVPGMPGIKTILKNDSTKALKDFLCWDTSLGIGKT